MSEIGDRIANVSLNYQGNKYVYGGKTPAGFDCSGFVRFVIKEVTGQDITGDSHAQMYLGIRVPRDKLEKGDILGFDTAHGTEVREGNKVSHVGIYIGNNRMMNCLSESLGCRVSDLSIPYWNGEGAHFVEARRFPLPNGGINGGRKDRVPRVRKRNPRRIRKGIYKTQLAAAALRQRTLQRLAAAHRLSRGDVSD